MVATSRVWAVLVGLTLPIVVAAGDLPSVPTLCALLGSIQAGEQRQVQVSGVYLVGTEQQVLYDPRTPLCDLDVQPATWVEFDQGAMDPAFAALPGSRFYVTFRGWLQGPGVVEEDDSRLPVIGSFANRVAFDRYGHLNAFRTQILVEEIVRFVPVPEGVELPLYQGSAAVAAAPRIQQGALPQYPEKARRAGIEGIVEMKVAVEKGKVSNIDRVSGDRILAAGSRSAIETWVFDEAYSGTFVTTFYYDLRLQRSGANPNPEIEIHLPYDVHLSAPADGW